MITGNWFVKTYECVGQYCYFGEWFCLNFPLHKLIILLLIIFLMLGIIKLWDMFRTGSETNEKVKSK